jgi:hypothetical protein
LLALKNSPPPPTHTIFDASKTGVITTNKHLVVPHSILSNPFNDDMMNKMKSLVKDFNAMNVKNDKFSSEDCTLIYGLKRTAREFISGLSCKGDILAGGCFTSFFHREYVKDYDIFVYRHASKMMLNDALLEDQRLGNVLRYTIRPGTYLNNGNIDQVIDDSLTRAQYVICDYPDREAVIDHFDAEHACVSYDHATDILHLSPLTWHCIKNKILKSHKRNTIQQWRQDKFIKKEFKIETECV